MPIVVLIVPTVSFQIQVHPVALNVLVGNMPRQGLTSVQLAHPEHTLQLVLVLAQIVHPDNFLH